LYADEIIEIWNIKKNYCTISVAYLLWSGYGTHWIRSHDVKRSGPVA